jgi:hypothetical protein
MSNGLRKVRRAGVFVLAACTLGGSATAQGVPPSEPASSPRLRFEAANPRSIEFYVPVVTMEQIKAAGTFLQGYRVQVYANGTIVYDGLADVKTSGEIRDHVAPDAVQAVLRGFRDYRFWQIPEHQFGSSSVHSWPTLVFTVREGTRSKTVYLAGQDQGLMLRKLVEDLVESHRWRCP